MAIFTALALAFPGTFGAGAAWLFGSARATQAFISIGKSLAWSMGAAAMNRPKVPHQQVQANINQTDGPRIKAYGRVLLGGQRAFWETNQDDGQLFQIILLHHGRVDALTAFWVDGQRVSVDSENRVTDRPFWNDGQTDLRLFFRDGGGEGGDYEVIRSKFPTAWTTAHKLMGQATMAAIMDHPGNERFSKVFPKGPQTLLQAEIRGSLVRIGNGSLAYSENPAWCIRDYLTHQDGWRIPSAAIDDISFGSFGNLCNEAVPLRAGGTEARYRLSGHLTLDDPPKEVTGRMLATCDGHIYQTADGKVGILGGKWSEPDVTITAEDILAFEAQDGFDPFTDFNVLKVSFISPDHAYQPTEVADRRDQAALETQPERVEQIDFDMVPSGGQAQRLQKIEFFRRRRALEGKLTTNLVGLKARFPKGDGIHTIRVIAPEFEVNGVFEVTSHSFDIASRTCEIGISSAVNPYTWDAATEERPLPAKLSEIEKPSTVIPAPTGVSLTQVPVRVSGDTYGGKLRLTVASVTRRDLNLQAQVARGNVAADSTTAQWTEMGGDRFTAETGILENEQVYTVRYRWRGQATWIKAGSVTIVANPNVPSAPTAFARVGTTGVSLKWTNPAANFWKARLFRGTTTNFADASYVKEVGINQSGAEVTTTDAPGAGTWRYWVVALNGSSVASPAAGPITITL